MSSSPIGRASRWLALFAGVGVCVAVCACSESAGGTAPGVAARRESVLRVGRGDFEDRFLLTGELEAARGDRISVPRMPSWQVGLKWIEASGTEVKKGQKVVELDNSEVSGNLQEKVSAAIKARHELARGQAQQASDLGDKELAAERKRLDREKARIQAAVPESLRSRRDYQDNQLAFKKAQVEFEKATDDLTAARKGAAADLANLQLALEKAEREVQVAENAIRMTTLLAPRDGIFLVADHPWEGRPLQVGDPVWTGMRIASLPDLTSLQAAATLSDVDDGRIRPGQKATAILDAYPDSPIPAEIVEVGNVAQEAGGQSLRRSFRVVARLGRSDTAKLRPGLSLRLIVIRQRRVGVLLAPREGLDFSQPVPRALLANGATSAVRLGPCNPQACVIESGLREGTRLRSSPPARSGGR